MGKFGISNLNIVEKTRNSTPSISKGSTKLQAIPNTEFLYLILRSEMAKLNKIPLVFHISSGIDVIHLVKNFSI